MQVKRAVFGSILEQRVAVHKDGCNVATPPRRDVPTSQRWVNIYRSQQAATSRRQREFCLSIIKSKKGTRIRGIGDRGSYKLGHGNQNHSDFDLGEEPLICIFPSFWIEVLTFYKLYTGVLIFSMF